jgi:large subunit ribosomal protein L23
MRIYRILKKPIVTEKTSNLEMTKSCYVFEVSQDATKIDVKKAISEIYWVQVESVNMVHLREKFKFGKKGAQTKRSAFKKAYITLKDKTAKIDFSLVK